jgi:LysM repeat protein
MHQSDSYTSEIENLLFQDLDLTCKTDWHTEVQSYVQTLESKMQTQITTPASPDIQARRAERAKRRQRFQKKSSKNKSNALAPVLLNHKRAARLPKVSARQLKIASALVLTGAVATGTYRVLHVEESPPPSIQQVMYQNAETKVAAFRQEIQDGDHFVVQHDKPIQYEAKSGDTIEKISRRYHVSPNTIVKNNANDKIEDVLAPGTQLTILPVDGIAHPVEKSETLAELSKRYDVGVQEIIEANQLDNPHMISERQKIIIPNATELKKRPKPVSVMQAIQASRTGTTPQTAISKTGRRLSWPSAGVVTSNYGWRWFRMHNGMDVAGPVGTAIKAVKEGRVVYSGWMGGYGYAIDVQHPNGLRTRYAHCSALKVSVGQQVARGQVIASMGSTGHSTGPHLHFEVHKNGSAVDPRGFF